MAHVAPVNIRVYTSGTRHTGQSVVSPLNSEMFHLKAPQTFALLLGVLVLLAAENHGFAPQHVEQKLTSNDFGITELALSLAVNQMAVLKILNESSTICSLCEFPLIVIVLKSTYTETHDRLTD